MPGETQAMDPKPDHGEESYKGSGRLAGKAALITGGDSGIGRAVALAFAREGADVLISYLDEHEDAKEAASWVEKAGKRVVLVPGDVFSEEHCKELVARTVKEFGKIDILVNNAASRRLTNRSRRSARRSGITRSAPTSTPTSIWRRPRLDRCSRAAASSPLRP